MGLTCNFRGKKGAQNFLRSEGGPKNFHDKIFLHQPPQQVFVNCPLVQVEAWLSIIQMCCILYSYK